MLGKDQEYLGVSISDDSIKLAHIKVSGDECKLIGVVKQDIREVPEEEQSSALSTALSELSIKNPRAICALPASLVTTKNIEIPSIDPEEIKSIIDLQAGRHTPYAREEILVGFITIGVFQRNYTKVLLIIVNRDAIKKQVDIFDRAGIKIERVFFAPEGKATFYAKALNVKNEEPPIGIIDISFQTTDFIIEFNNTVATCRSIPIGMNHLIKEGETAKNQLVEELSKSLAAYEEEDINKSPETYILTSDDEKIKELQPLLQDKLKSNIKVVSYLDQIQADQQVMLKLVSQYNDDSFLNLISVTSMMNAITVDLTPEDVKAQRSIEEQGRQIVKVGVLGIVFLFFIIAIFFCKIYFRGIFLGRLKEEYVVKRKEVVALDRVAQKTRIIKDYINSRMIGLNVVDELYRLIPDEIYLQSILLNEEGRINIQGISESMSRVFNFVTALEESEYFKSVKTTSTTAKKDRGKDVAAFEIVFRLESTDDEEDEEMGEEMVEEADAE